MYRVFFVNFGYFSQNESASFEEACLIAKRAGFEAAIYNPAGEVCATWSVFGGVRRRTADLQPLASI